MGKELKRALLIFARRPVPGTVKTRLVPSLAPEEAAELYRCMLCDLLAKAATLSGCTLYLYYEEADGAREYFHETARDMTCRPQLGKDLGERMAEAFSEVFAMGHATAVIIGTDSPDLPRSFIEEAFARLEKGEGEALFGPSEDGGYYLAGMTRLHRELFRDVPWSSGTVLQESLKRAKEAGIVVSLLPGWYDVDTAADLERPELLDENNDAPLTRELIKTWIEARGSRTETKQKRE